MSVSQDELDRFHKYASARIQNGGSDVSLQELVESWLQTRPASEERAAVNAVLRRSIQEMEAGLDRPAEDVMQEIRIANCKLPICNS